MNLLSIENSTESNNVFDWGQPPPKNEILVDNQTRSQRMSICKSCEFLELGYTCRHCLCIMPIKTYIKNSKCPKDKW